MSARSLVLALVLAVSGIGGSAKAALIQVNSLPVQLTNIPFSITIGGAATYTFTAATAAETGNGPGAAVATSGTARVSSFFGDITDFGGGAMIDGSGLYSFTAFPSRTVIPNSPAVDFIGLAFTLPGGLRYGYAEVFGPRLVRLVYESSPGVGIVTGASPVGPSPVPEPATFALLGAGLGLLVAARRRRIT